MRFFSSALCIRLGSLQRYLRGVPSSVALAALLVFPVSSLVHVPEASAVSYLECRGGSSSGVGTLYLVQDFGGGHITRTVIGTCTPDSVMDGIQHSSAGSLTRTATRFFDRGTVSGMAYGNPVVQSGQRRSDDDDPSDTFGMLEDLFGGSRDELDDDQITITDVERQVPVPPSLNNIDVDALPDSTNNYAPAQPSGFSRPFAQIDAAMDTSSSAFSTIGGVRFDTPRFDGITVDTNVRSLSVDSPFVDTEVVDFQSDTFATYSLAPRLQVQAGLLNSYSHVDIEGGGSLDVWRSEVYAGSFVGVLPWLWLDGSVALGFSHFDGTGTVGDRDELAPLFSTNAGVSVIAAMPNSPWAGVARAGVNFLHVGVDPDPVNQTKLDLSARIGRAMDWGPGGGAFYLGYNGSTAIANPAVPAEDWTNLIEAGVIFALPDLGILRLSGDVMVGDSHVENFSAKVTFHLFPNRG